VHHVRSGDALGPTDQAHGQPWHARTALSALWQGGSYLSTDSMIVPALLGRRATLVVHDLAPLVHPQAHHRRARVFFRLLLGVACRRVGAVVVPSAATGDDLVRRYPAVSSRLHVVPEAPRQLPPPGALPAAVVPPYVLHTGTHEPRKNVLALVEGFLSHPVPEPWSLVLAGRPGWLSAEEAARLDALVEGSHGRVVRLGFVSDPLLAGLYANADLFAYPSAYEGFGLPVAEAMYAGVAVVTTDAAALGEVAGDAAEQVPLGPGLAQRLGATISRLAGDPATRADLVRRGRERAASFDWDRTAAGVHAAVQSTVRA
jgi:glycosyltransferase involved in cell wall biosynthesis